MLKKYLFAAAAGYVAISSAVIYSTYFKQPGNKEVVSVEDTMEQELAQSEEIRTEEATKEFAEVPVIEPVVEEPKEAPRSFIPSIFRKKEPEPVVEVAQPKSFAKRTKEIFLGPDPKPRASSTPASRRAKEIVEKPVQAPKKSWFSKAEPEQPKAKPLIVKKASPKNTDHRDMNVFRQHGKDGEYRGNGSKSGGLSGPTRFSSLTVGPINVKQSNVDHRDMKVFSQHQNSR